MTTVGEERELTNDSQLRKHLSLLSQPQLQHSEPRKGKGTKSATLCLQPTGESGVIHT